MSNQASPANLTPLSDGAEPDASAEITPEQLVIMRLAKEEYGVGITHVREIIRMQKITEVPQAPEHVKGIINLRGAMIPVVDLRKRFALNIAEATPNTRIFVVDVRDYTVGLVVDSVTEMITVASTAVEPISSLAAANLSHDLRGVVNHDDRLIIMIDLGALLTTIEEEETQHQAA